MSRNARQKPPQPRAPKPKKRRISDTTATSSSSLDLSNDEGYSAVDEISESEDDDEEHVFAAEEEHIISHAAHRGHSHSLPPQQDAEDDADEEDDDDEDEDDTELPELPVEDAEQAEDDDDEVASWDGIPSDHDEPPSSDLTANYMLDPNVANVERHVRFTGVPDSDSDSTTTDTTTEDVEGFFPDIFVEQGSLDPAFRREIEYDPEDSSNSGGSFWDFGSQDRFEFDSDEDVPAQGPDDSTPTPTPSASQFPTENLSPLSPGFVQELDGYETDGDTTEEDVPEPPIRRKLARRIESVDFSSDSDTERPRRKRGQPRLGRYDLDSSDRKPVAVLNPITRKMMIFTPQRMRRLDLSPESFNLDFFSNPMVPDELPILSNSASLMMGAMFSSNTFGDFVNTQGAVGPSEAFFANALEGMEVEESDETGENDDAEDEEERNLKLDDFITFNPDNSDEEGGQGDNWDGETNTAASTPGRPGTSASRLSSISDGTAAGDIHPLLSHFDQHSNVVGAFRRNQINQQLILSDRASHESLAFSGPYNYGTLRGIKTGSMETVTAPITPLRRHKKSAASINGYADLNKSPLESMSQKRKASSTPMADLFHKRHRSISDMEVMHL